MWLKRTVLLFSLLTLLTLFAVMTKPVYADWPMAGQNNQRTGNSSDLNSMPVKSCGFHAFDAYIPSKTQIITVDRGGNNMVYVPTSKGVYALKPSGLTNSASDIIWFYATSMPVGHSPTVDKSTGVMYIPSLDKTIHAVNSVTGAKVWQTDKAGGSFLVSPLVANGKVYAGNRDGYFYAFNASDGKLSWYFKTDGPIEYSAALSRDGNTIYFASNDMKAYALNAGNGQLKASSSKFQGWGFYSFWPVVYDVSGQPSRVLFSKGPNYPENYLSIAQQEAQIGSDPTGSLSVSGFVSYYNKYPEREVLLILDPNNLQKKETSPHLWWGNASGNHYPPAIASDGRIWGLQNWKNTNPSPFGQGGFASWLIGDSNMQLSPNPKIESGDEPRAFTILGKYIGYGHGGDGADTFGFTGMTVNETKSWSNCDIFKNWGKWYQYWNTFVYGNWLTLKYGTDGALSCWGSNFGTHGNQSPLVSLGSRAYINRSNSILCLE